MTHTSPYRLSYILILFPLLLLFHHEFIIRDPLLFRDDILIVSALDLTKTFPEYLEKFFNGFYYDIQPVRDLSFYLNIKLYHTFGYGAFHITNLILAFAILYLLHKVLLHFKFSEKSIFWGILILALHPIFNTTTAWVSNRKHLLSIFFLLLFYLDQLKSSSTGWRSFGLCILSFLSQPITIFIPAFYILHQKFFNEKKLSRWDWGIIFFSAFLLVLNHHFYSTNIRFLERNKAIEMTSSMGNYLQKIGRVPFQIIIPIRLAVEYNDHSLVVIPGIALLVISVAIFLKFFFTLKRAFFITIILTSLFPVISWGPRDPYLLLTLMGYSVLVSFFVEYRFNRKFYIFLIPYLFFLTYQSQRFTRIWLNDLDLTRSSYEIEGGMNNFLIYILATSHLNPRKSYELLDEVVEKYGEQVPQPVRYRRSKALFEATYLTDEEKLKTFRERKDLDVFDAFFMSKIHERLGNAKARKNAENAILETFKDPYSRQSFIHSVCIEFPNDCRRFGLL